MTKLSYYLNKVYQEKQKKTENDDEIKKEIIISSKELAANKEQQQQKITTTTYDLKLINGQIEGTINGQDIGIISIDEFIQKYPEIAKEVLETLKRDGVVKFTTE